jgi:hypothetical protein
MMPATRRQIPGTPWLIVAVIGLAAAAGYWCGSVLQEAETRGRGRVNPPREHRERNVVPIDPPLTAVGLVREAVKGTLDARQQWRSVRCLSEDEVKAAIAEVGNVGADFNWSSSFQAMLYFRWGELDPVAANAAAKEMFPKNFSSERRAVIATWIKQGAAVAVWEAVRDEAEMWACTQSVPVEVAEMLVASFSDLDHAAAFREVLRLNDENSVIADFLCRARARKTGSD